MKNLLIVIILSGFVFFVHSQDFTNAPGSQYAFKEIKKLEATPVCSQGVTGTCWSYSALSFFESEMIRMGKKMPAILSQMYVARKAYEGKAEKYIRMDGKINFAQGGAFHDIPWVFRNYGIVPNAVYDGLNYGLNAHNHDELYSGLNGYLQGVLKYVQNKGNDPLSPSWKTGFNGILDAYFGKDPQKFTFNGKEYTPKSYAKETGLNMDNYLSLTSFTHFPEYSECMLAIQDNWAWGSSYNVSLEDLQAAVEYALKNGYTVAWGADVSEKGFNFRKGIAIVPQDENTIEVRGSDNLYFSDAGAEKVSNAFMMPVKEKKITPEMRQTQYDNKTTTDDHGMHITGIYEEKNGTKFFLVKNSWGTGNYPEGYLYVSESYFKLKTINIYLHKDAIPQEIKSKLKI
ncbi:MAG: C1 family peptidase [Brumimicrobium sp.]|nr:C1 family peptidase [Brumimicrobium sp.]